MLPDGLAMYFYPMFTLHPFFRALYKGFTLEIWLSKFRGKKKVNRNRFSFFENFFKGILISYGINLVFKVNSEGFLSSHVPGHTDLINIVQQSTKFDSQRSTTTIIEICLPCLKFC